MAYVAKLRSGDFIILLFKFYIMWPSFVGKKSKE